MDLRLVLSLIFLSSFLGCAQKKKAPELVLNTYVISEPFYYVDRGELWLNDLTPLPDFIKDKDEEFRKKEGRYDVSYLAPGIGFNLKLSDLFFSLSDVSKEKSAFAIKVTNAHVANIKNPPLRTGCSNHPVFSFNLTVKSSKKKSSALTGFILRKETIYYENPQSQISKEYTDFKSYMMEYSRRQYRDFFTSEAKLADFIDKSTVAVRDPDGGLFFISAVPTQNDETAQIHFFNPTRRSYEFVRATTHHTCGL